MRRACHIFTVLAVLPAVSRRFERACFVSAAALLSALLLLLPGFWLCCWLLLVSVDLMVCWELVFRGCVV